MRKMSACDPKRTQLGVRLPLPEHTRELLPSGRRSNAYLIEFRIDNEVMRGTGLPPQHAKRQQNIMHWLRAARRESAVR